MLDPVAIEFVGLDILHQEGTRKMDGRGYVALMLARELQRLGHPVDLLSPGPRLTSPRFRDCGRVRPVGHGVLPATSEGHTRYSALVANHWSIVDRLRDVRVLYCPHEIERLRSARTGDRDIEAIESQEALFDLAAWIWVPSHGIADFLVNELSLPREKVLLKPYGIDCTLFRPLDRLESRQRLGLDAQEDILLYVGRLELRKGLDTLRSAFEKITNKRHARLLIVGEASPDGSRMDQEAAAEFARWADGQAQVTLCGAQPWDELPYFYAAANVCVFPSLMEPFGLPTAEALACGRPVVGSDIDGFRTLIRPELDGILVTPRDAEAFATGIERILDDISWGSTDSVARFVERARSFSWPRVAQELSLSIFTSGEDSCKDNVEKAMVKNMVNSIR